MLLFDYTQAPGRFSLPSKRHTSSATQLLQRPGSAPSRRPARNLSKSASGLLTPSEPLVKLAKPTQPLSKIVYHTVPKERAPSPPLGLSPTEGRSFDGSTHAPGPAALAAVAAIAPQMLNSDVEPVLDRTQEEHAADGFARMLRTAASTREDCSRMLRCVHDDFEKNFPHHNDMRGAASSMLVKSANIVGRLRSACRDVEYAAAACLTLSHVGQAEREKIISDLQMDMHRRDVDVANAANRMANALAQERRDAMHEKENVDAEAGVGAAALVVELKEAEEIIQELIDGGARSGRLFEEQRKRLVQRLQGIACRRLVNFELASGWSQWAHGYAERKRMMKQAAIRFAQGALVAAVRKWATKHKPKSRLRRELTPYTDRIRELEEMLRKEREAHSETRHVYEARLHDSEMGGTRKQEIKRKKRVRAFDTDCDEADW